MWTRTITNVNVSNSSKRKKRVNCLHSVIGSSKVRIVFKYPHCTLKLHKKQMFTRLQNVVIFPDLISLSNFFVSVIESYRTLIVFFSSDVTWFFDGKRIDPPPEIVEEPLTINNVDPVQRGYNVSSVSFWYLKSTFYVYSTITINKHKL